MATTQPPLELENFMAILRRRKKHLFAPVLLILGIATALAYLLPPVYRSEATILIERQSIPVELIKTTVTGFVQEQIEVIRQRIVTHENLLRIADQFDLYPEIRRVDPGKAVKLIRDNIEVAMVDIKAGEPSAGNQKRAKPGSTFTIAFTVSFSAKTPDVAQAIANELANRYLEENRATRNRQAAQVSDFLTREADALKQEIARQEKSLASFKQKHLEELPEMMGMNLKLYEKTEEEIGQARDAMRNLREQANALQAELSLTSPFKAIVSDDGKRMLSAADRLSQLTAEYLRASAKYSTEHPDIVRMRHEISVLARQTRAGARTDELLTELVALQQRLAQARQRYAEEHPAVKKLAAAVAAVERGLQSTLIGPAATAAASSASAIPPDNPHYVALETQLHATQSELKAVQKRYGLLQEKLQAYEERLFQTPIAERDFKTLSRDYANNLKKFEELKGKQLQARWAEQLEAGDNAERFVLASAAELPATPESPNRLGILLLGGFFSILGGLGSVGFAEYTDRTVHGPQGVATLLGAPPLAVIPLIKAANAPPRHDDYPQRERKPKYPPTYEVVFEGQIVEGFDPAKVKAEFGRIFRLTPPRVEQVFSHPEVVLQKKLSSKQALRHQSALSSLGLKTYLRPTPAGGEQTRGGATAAAVVALIGLAAAHFPSTDAWPAVGNTFPSMPATVDAIHG